MPIACTLCVLLTGKCCFLCGIALIFVSWLVLNLLTGAGAYIKHERDLYAFSSVYQIYCTAVTFEVWLQREIIVGIYMQYMEPVLFPRI